MNIKTRVYNTKCPYCGSYSFKSLRHSDGIISIIEKQCAKCNHWYVISKTYDADSAVALMLLDNIEEIKDAR